MAISGELRLYALDGGSIRATGDDATGISDDGAYEGRTLDMPVPCYLIRHPEGDLMWETGMSPNRTDLGEWATPGVSLVDQLWVLGLAPSDIRFLALSHGHWDDSATPDSSRDRPGSSMRSNVGACSTMRTVPRSRWTTTARSKRR